MAAIAAKRGAPAAQAVVPQVQAVPLCGTAKRKQYCLYCFLFVGADNRTTDKASPFLAGGSVTFRPFLLKTVYQTVFLTQKYPGFQVLSFSATQKERLPVWIGVLFGADNRT